MPRIHLDWKAALVAVAAVFALSLAAAGAANAARFAGGGRAAATSIQRPASGNVGANRNMNANHNFNSNGNFNNNTNINRNVNANVNRNVNVNVDNGWNHGGCCCCGYSHPVAAGVAIGATAAITAAAIGSMAYSLPPACVTRVYPAGTYYSCGGTWYQPEYAGSQVTYVVVHEPG